MALAETAQLVTRLSLQDQLTPGLLKARAGLGGLSTGATAATGGISLFQRATGGVRTALSTLGSRIGQVVSLLGFAGLTGGLIGVVAFLRSAVEETRDFAKEVGQMAKLTGLSTETTSALSAAFHHYGIDASTALTITALAEKNLFRLGGTAKSATAFQQKYGFSLRDSSGNLKDFNELILTASDYFLNKHIPAAQKDAALAALFGRNWRALIPVLSAGGKAIESVEQEAQRLGLTLTKDNLAALSKAREATRNWGTALAGLKIQLGVTLIPLLAQVTVAFTKFLTTADKTGTTGSQKIVAFLKGVITFGQNVASVIGQQVVPVLQKVIGGWNNLPTPLKSLLIRGITGNYAIKFLLGFDPIGLALGVASAAGAKLAGSIAGTLGGSLLGRFFKGLADRGSTPANPLWVQMVGGPGGGGVPNILGKVGGAGGWLTTLLGGASLGSVAATAAAGGALILGLGFLFSALGGFKNRGDTATGAGPTDPFGIGPKGQLRTGGALGGRPTPVTLPQRTEASIERSAVLQAQQNQLNTRQLAATIAARQISSADQSRLRATETAAHRATQARIQALHPPLSRLEGTERNFGSRTVSGLAQLRTAINASRTTLSSISSRTASVRAAVVHGHAITGRGFQRTIDGVHGTTHAVNRKKLSFRATVNVSNKVVISNTEIWTKLNRLRVALGTDSTNTGGSV